MKRIKLTCGDARLETTCKGICQHIHNKRVVHGLSKNGYNWIETLPEDHPTIRVSYKGESLPLDYLSEEPLP